MKEIVFIKKAKFVTSMKIVIRDLLTLVRCSKLQIE